MNNKQSKASAPIQIDLQDLLGKVQGPQVDVSFVEATEGEESFHQNDLIQLEVYGLSLNADPNHPILLLKDKTEKYILSVLVNPLEAGVTLTQSNKSIAPVTPHRFAQELLKAVGMSIKQCVFVQIKGTHQYVRIYLQGHPKVSSLKLRADEVMSLVLHLNIPIFASKSFIEKSKLLNVRLGSMMQNQTMNSRIVQKNQSYVI